MVFFLKRFKVDHLQKNLTWFHISFTLKAILLPLLYWPLLDNSCNVILIIYVSCVCVCYCTLWNCFWCNCRVQLIEGLLYAGAKQVVHGPVERTGLQTNDSRVPTINYNKFLSAYRRKSRKKWVRALVRGPVGARQHGDSCGSLQNPQGEDRWDGQAWLRRGVCLSGPGAPFRRLAEGLAAGEWWGQHFLFSVLMWHRGE